MSEPLIIQSHTGPYTAEFDTAALDKLNADVPENAHFIIDARIADLYGDKMGVILASPSVLLIDALEDNKSLEKMPGYVDHLVGKGVRRDHRLVAMGGGIIQDITCFLATTILRGVDWHFYPTTLLAQADSCIGSKSSINCGAAKNILGSFTPPKQVTISTTFLDTLDERDIRSGIGEMLKVQAIDGAGSFDRIAADYQKLISDRATMVDYIRDSLLIKKRYIEEDEFDAGIRNVFNYGHSFGHAIEAATRFAIPHGIAVTIGMDMANFMAARLGVGSDENFRRMHPVLKSNYRDFEDFAIPIEPFIAAISKDKKNIGANSVTLILPDRDGVMCKDAYPNDALFADGCQIFLNDGRAR